MKLLGQVDVTTVGESPQVNEESLHNVLVKDPIGFGGSVGVGL